jgi:starch-binding outer membrane protein, SusD/RagB family
MKKYWIILLCLPLFLSSCMEILEKPDYSSAGSYIWDDYGMAQMYLDNLYLDDLPGSAWGENITTTDEALGTGASNLLWGLSGINSAITYSEEFWARMRRINIMIQEMDESSQLPANQKNLLLGQARFLRAIQYWQLVRLYGGVPIMRKPLQPSVDDIDVPRSTTGECVRFIAEDLDFAIKNLPGDWTVGDPTRSDFGRLTKYAAMAYKGRVLLTYASPMFCERDAYVSRNNGATVSEFKISQDSINSRWQAAYDANKMALDSLTANGYALMTNLDELFTTEVISNTEDVMVRLYTGVNYTHNWEFRIRPFSLGGQGYNINPTIELERAFLMADGKRTSDTTSGYEYRFFWMNREPRFYKTLVYNGANWDMGGSAGRKQWIYDGTSEEAGSLPYSGMYCRKGQDASLTRDNLARGRTDWMEIRFAEVMLNFAECANELDFRSQAVDQVRAIRKRAGIVDSTEVYGVASTLTKVEMLDAIMNERFIEFAFENQRYWDLRRRMMYTRDLSPTTKKLNNSRRTGWEIWTAVLPTKPPKDMLDSLELADAQGKLYKNKIVFTKDNYYRFFDPDLKTFDLNRVGNPNPANPRSSLGINYLPEYYFQPIGTDRFSNSKNLLQTIGWGYGTYDPLAD